MTEVLFFIGLFGVSYSYFIYPLILVLITKTRKKCIYIVSHKTHPLPSISFIITAYNEENQIAKKIENTLLVKYPSDKIEIIVASDGSSDKTNEIVDGYKNRGVTLHPVLERKGKENAQKSAIEISIGDILVFSDVSTQIENTALLKIAKRFEDPMIGAISSEDRFLTESGEVAGEGAYVKYEMWLRQLESRVNSLVGLSGSFFTARREVCNNWNINVPSDFNTALNCIHNELIAVTDSKLLGFYPNLKDETKEYQRKVRTVIRGMAALSSQAFIMNPFKHGFFAFQVISHKLMRWLVPWFLLLTLVTNFLLFKLSYFYKFSFTIQVLFYGMAITGYLSTSARQTPLIKICYFFIQVNLAIFHSSLMYISGKRVTLWEPSKR